MPYYNNLMSKKWILFFLLITLVAGALYLHTNTLALTYHEIVLNKGSKKLRLAHVTDLHTKGMGRLEKQLIKALIKEKPDVIVITGDLSTPSGTIEGYESVLKEFHAPGGVYFVQGNWEYWEPISELGELLDRNNIKNLTNLSHQIKLDLWIVGFDDSEEGQPAIKILDAIPKSTVKIGLFHSPAFFEEIAGLTDLNLAGHSHGGQFRIPFFGHFWVPEGTGKFDQGWFKKNRSKLFVSRGIGTSLVPIRFNCSPELAIIDIKY